MKQCKKCGEEKNEIFFSKETRQKDGLRLICKTCVKILMDEKKYYKNPTNIERNKKYNLDNREKLQQQSKQYYYNNKEKIYEYHNLYREENKEKINQYYQDNKEEILLNKKEYYKENREKIIYKNIQYRYGRLKKDPLFKLTCYIRNTLYISLKNMCFSKHIKTSKILGCDFIFFKQYIESLWEPWMNWENYGKYNGELNYGWDLDHIIPISSAKTEEHIYLLNHYTNFQPLCSYTNRYIKGDKLNY